MQPHNVKWKILSYLNEKDDWVSSLTLREDLGYSKVGLRWAINSLVDEHRLIERKYEMVKKMGKGGNGNIYSYLKINERGRNYVKFKEKQFEENYSPEITFMKSRLGRIMKFLYEQNDWVKLTDLENEFHTEPKGLNVLIFKLNKHRWIEKRYEEFNNPNMSIPVKHLYIRLSKKGEEKIKLKLEK